MQKLTFVPAGKTRADVSDLVVISSVKSPATLYVLNSPTGLGAVDVNLSADVMARQDGEYLHSVQLGARTVHDTISVRGDTRAEMYARRERLIQLLSPKRGMGTLYYQNDHGEWRIQAIPTAYGVANARLVRDWCSVSVSFLCPDPLWRETVTHETALFSAAPPVSLPAALPAPLPLPTVQEYIYNTSQAGAETELVVHGACKNLRICNYTTGESAVLTVALGERDTARLTTGRLTVARDGGGSAVLLPEYGYSDITLAPGENRIGVSAEYSGGGCAVAMRWTRLYAGV